MLHEINFKSSNKRDTVYGFCYVPASEVKGIIQLIHGLGEHSRRYIHMISKFLDHGFIVCCDDHVGHGKTAMENKTWCDYGDQGYETMVKDEKILHDKVRELYKDLPYFIYGHSMGSMIAREYMARFPEDLRAVSLCGTVSSMDGLDEFIQKLEKEVEAGRGEEDGSKFIGELFADFFNQVEEEVTIGNEWICHDKYVQVDHAKDPFNSFTKPMQTRSILYFSQMLAEVVRDDWYKKVPQDLPIYNIAGSEDPAGGFGKGVLDIDKKLKDSGHKIETKIYDGYRHEIHNYKDIRDQVEDGIVKFFEKHL